MGSCPFGDPNCMPEETDSGLSDIGGDDGSDDDGSDDDGSDDDGSEIDQDSPNDVSSEYESYDAYQSGVSETDLPNSGGLDTDTAAATIESLGDPFFPTSAGSLGQAIAMQSALSGPDPDTDAAPSQNNLSLSSTLLDSPAAGEYFPRSPFSDLTLNLAPDIVSPELLDLPVPDMTTPDSSVPSDTPSFVSRNPFPDLSLNLSVDNFNWQSSFILGKAIAAGLPLSLDPVDLSSASNLSVGNWSAGVQQVAGMLDQWLAGTAPELTVYGPDATQTQDMMSAPGVQKALDFYYAKNAGLSLDQQQSVVNFNPYFGLPGYLASATDLNPTQFFVGDYRLDLYPQADGTILIVASNTTSITSLVGQDTALGRLVIPDRWNRPTGSPMGNASQIYYWTVPNQSLQQTSQP
jgi:hypothetical protein